MTIGAFLDAGLKLKTLKDELAKLKLKGYRLGSSKVTRGSISGTKFSCVVTGREPHGHRSVKDINAIIDRSGLSDKVKKTARDIFGSIASAEMKVHGLEKGKTAMLHELGDIDSIVDIVGTAIAIDALGIDAIYSSKVSLGRAIVKSRHGNIPATSPAALELLKGVPISISEIEAELVTPTGAGIIKTLSDFSGLPPRMEITAIGYGAGSKDIRERPNMLRIMIGEAKPSFMEDSVYVVETNIDDMSPQNIAYAMDRLLAAGALDSYVANIQMKKSRPAFKLTAITDGSNLRKIASLIFSETSAIGIRFYEAGRLKLERAIKKVKTSYGTLDVKVSKGPGGIRTVSPEYDDCVRMAIDKKAPLKKVYEAARLAAGSFVFILSAALLFAASSLSWADTISTSDGKEVKGIIVEDYKDRVVLSTVNGEKVIMKSDIDELYYDNEEDNLIKLAEQSKEKRDYIKALTYYDMAFKANPDSKAAKDGLVFLEGYLFRKEQSQKEDDVRKREDLEGQMSQKSVEPPKVEEMSEKVARLRKTLGLVLTMKGGFPCIESIKPRSPAEDAGLREGDRIRAIWARLTGYMNLEEVIDALLDKPSLEIKCTIDRVINIEYPVDASFSMEPQGLTVSSVPEDGRSYAAGLKKGDMVTEIKGNSTRYLPLRRAVNVMKGPRGKSIGLTVQRETLIWRRD